jgi:hypothetical protein
MFAKTFALAMRSDCYVCESPTLIGSNRTGARTKPQGAAAAV